MLKAATKNYVRKLAVQTRLLEAATHFAASGAIILMYHSVRDDPAELANLISPTIVHSTAIFQRQMELIASKFAPVTLDDIFRFLKGEVKLPRKAVAVTFDDGFADNEEIAAPILQRLGIRGAFYATVDLIGTRKAPWYCRLRYAFLTTVETRWTDVTRQTWSLQDLPARERALQRAFDLCAPLVGDGQEDAIRHIEKALDAQAQQTTPLMMSWEQLRKLQAAGHIVGSHTRSHPNVAHIAEKDLERELSESKQALEAGLRTPIVHFSYPHPALNPHWSGKTLDMTAAAGYNTAVTTTIGGVPRNADPLCLKRVHVPRREYYFRWNLSRALLDSRPG